MSDLYAVACNYSSPTAASSKGARCLVGDWQAGNGYERIRIVARSRGGRRIHRWEDIRRLTNFRATTIPPEHPAYQADGVGFHETRDAAEKMAEALIKAQQRESAGRPTPLRQAEPPEPGRR